MFGVIVETIVIARKRVQFVKLLLLTPKVQRNSQRSHKFPETTCWQGFQNSGVQHRRLGADDALIDNLSLTA